MVTRFKNIASFLVVLSLLAPSAIKLSHKHDHHFCTAKNESHLHKMQGECAVCDFVFSIFLKDEPAISSSNIALTDIYVNSYEQVPCSRISKYSFLLRAPPSLTKTTGLS